MGPVLDAEVGASNDRPGPKRGCNGRGAEAVDRRHASPLRVRIPLCEGLTSGVEANQHCLSWSEVPRRRRPELHAVGEMHVDPRTGDRGIGRVGDRSGESLVGRVVAQDEAGTGAHHVPGLGRVELYAGSLATALAVSCAFPALALAAGLGSARTGDNADCGKLCSRGLCLRMGRGSERTL